MLSTVAVSSRPQWQTRSIHRTPAARICPRVKVGPVVLIDFFVEVPIFRFAILMTKFCLRRQQRWGGTAPSRNAWFARLLSPDMREAEHRRDR